MPQSPSAPQQAAGHLLRELHAAPGDRAFVRTVLLAWLGLSAAAAVVALLLDPLGTFGTGLAPPLLWRDRDEKAEAFLKYEPKPETVVVGSSHVMKLRPACLTELTGMRAFNFGVSAARAEDYLAVLRFVEANGRGTLKRLLIGVDPDAFNGSEDMGRLLLASRHLRQYAPLEAPSRAAALGPDLLGAQVALASWRSARGLLEGASISRLKAFDPDGFIRYLRWESEARAGTLPLDDNIRASADEFRSRYRSFSILDPVRVALFRELLGEAHTTGVEVDAYIPPVHPKVLRLLIPTPSFSFRWNDTEALLGQLAEQGLLRYHDLKFLRRFGGDPREFFDGEHMTEVNTRRLLLAMHGRDEGCALQ